ncbi:hypothetical protein AVEN_183784-1 [Araneus ventricosus]|uniref:Uncharacterized protein n=1 Tax=Araneus ventricosus TaxID=182803 RepID=A0A4Y2MTD8_ARAVE|nr:hypothetical protein AVEN_183784-1 [Araneus ventricosus]
MFFECVSIYNLFDLGHWSSLSALEACQIFCLLQCAVIAVDFLVCFPRQQNIVGGAMAKHRQPTFTSLVDIFPRRLVGGQLNALHWPDSGINRPNGFFTSFRPMHFDDYRLGDNWGEVKSTNYRRNWKRF